jgi:hypothetical protein
MDIDFSKYRILSEGEVTKEGDVYISSNGKVEPFEWYGLTVQKNNATDIYRLKE